MTEVAPLVFFLAAIAALARIYSVFAGKADEFWPDSICVIGSYPGNLRFGHPAKTDKAVIRPPPASAENSTQLPFVSQANRSQLKTQTNAGVGAANDVLRVDLF